jgi:hypothetical protein
MTPFKGSSMSSQKPSGPLAALALALALTACDATSGLPGACQVNADCGADAGSGLQCTGGYCQPTCGDKPCDVASGAFECITTGATPVCQQATCHPACDLNHDCDTNQSPPACIPKRVATLQFDAPADGSVTGVKTPLAVSADVAGPGTLSVQFRVEQVQGATTIKATSLAQSGIGATFNNTIDLTGAGFVSSGATLIGAVTYTDSTSAVKTVEVRRNLSIAADPPTIGTPTVSGANSGANNFFSGLVAGENAIVTVAINPSTASAVLASSVDVTVGSHTYVPATTPASGTAGTYTFAVPAADLNSSAGFQGTVAFTVNAADGVGNAGTQGGVISVDNKAPTFANPVVPTAWFGATGAIQIKMDVSDPAGGSGLNAASVKLTGGSAPVTGSLNVNTATFNIANGAAIQTANSQTPLSLTVNAADNAGNTGSATPVTLKVDLKAPAVNSIVIPQNAGNPGGWYAQSAAAVPVVITVDDAAGSGPASVTMTSPAGPGSSSSGTAAGGTAVSYTINVAPSAFGSATGLSTNTVAVTTTDAVGNTSAAVTSTQTMKIDNQAPVISNVTLVTAPKVTLGSGGSAVNWYKQSDPGLIEVDADITDGAGSGLNTATVGLFNGSTQLDNGSPTIPGSGSTFKFFIARSGSAPLIGAGAQGQLPAISVVAKDKVGNTGTQAAPNIGIDGQVPTVSITPVYPNGDCASGVAFCGHDGSHFWRRGETATLTISGGDGSGGAGFQGLAAEVVSCSIGDSALSSKGCGSLTAGAAGSWTLVPDFTGVTLAGVANDSTGTADISVTIRDAVGNQASLSAPVSLGVTRVKWIRSLGLGSLVASNPIVTSSPVPMVIAAGTTVTAPGPIATVSPGGVVLGTFGNNGTTVQLGAIGGDLTYSSTTNLLYAFTQATGTVFALHLKSDATGFDTFASNNGLTNLIGAPAIVAGAGGEYVLASDDSFVGVFSLHCSPTVGGGSCSQKDSVKKTGTTAWGSHVSTPVTDGTKVYVGHDSNTIAQVPISDGTFGTVVDAAGPKMLGNAAVAGDAYVADILGAHLKYSAFTTATFAADAAWTGGGQSNPAAATPTSSPVVASSMVFGTFDDGHLYGFSAATGSSTSAGFQFPSATGNNTGFGTLSAPSVGSDGVVYLGVTNFPAGGGGKSNLVAISTSGTPAVVWNYRGSGTALIGAGGTSEPVIDSSGTLYFGDSAGQLFAIITDSPATNTSGGWPRVGFDNCNSGNSAFSCQ